MVEKEGDWIFVTKLLEELEKEIDLTRRNLNEVHRLSPNSFGAGYEHGYLQGLHWLKDLLLADD